MSMCIETNCFIKPKRNEQYNTRLLGSITTFIDTNFCNSEHLKTFPGVMQGPTQNLGPIGLAVLTFIGYKQKDKQTSKVYIYRYLANALMRNQ